MRKKINIIHLFSLGALCFAIPFENLKFVLIPIWLIILTSNYKQNYLFIVKSKTRKVLALSLLLYYIILWISVLYSSNKIKAVHLMESYASIGLLPLFVNASTINFKRIKYILACFTLGSLIISLYLLIRAFLRWDGEAFATFPTYVNLTRPLAGPSFHPTNMGIYSLFSFAITGYLFKNIQIKKVKVLLGLIMFWFVFFTILTMTKTALLCLVLVAIGQSIYLLNLSKRRKIWTIALILIAIFSTVLIVKKYIPQRIESSKNEMQSIDKDNLLQANYLGSTESRYMIWYTSFYMWKKSPYWGFGIGDATEKLYKGYEELGQQFLSKIRYKAHSQYFATLLASGIIGLLSLLFIVVTLIINAIRKNSFLCTVICIVFVISMATEEYLQIFTGSTFIGIMIGLLFLSNPFNHSKNENLSS